MARRVLIANQDTALYLGLACSLAGALLLRDAFEDRGKKKPWALKLLGLAT